MTVKLTNSVCFFRPCSWLYSHLDLPPLPSSYVTVELLREELKKSWDDRLVTAEMRVRELEGDLEVLRLSNLDPVNVPLPSSRPSSAGFRHHHPDPVNVPLPISRPSSAGFRPHHPDPVDTPLPVSRPPSVIFQRPNEAPNYA